MATVYGVSDMMKLKDRKIFFDANVLLYIFWPTCSSSGWASLYSKIFSKLLRQDNQLFVDYIVISEVINRALRFEYNKYIVANSLDRGKFTFKKYRHSPDGKDASNDIYLIVSRKILDNFNVSGQFFDKKDLQNFLVLDQLDFSDKGIVEICRNNSFVLLTNDADFSGSGLDLLTSNSKIK